MMFTETTQIWGRSSQAACFHEAWELLFFLSRWLHRQQICTHPFLPTTNIHLYRPSPHLSDKGERCAHVIYSCCMSARFKKESGHGALYFGA